MKKFIALFLVLVSSTARAEECHTVEQLKQFILPNIDREFGDARMGALSKGMVSQGLNFYNEVIPVSYFVADDIEVVETKNPNINFVFLFSQGCFVGEAIITQPSLESLMGIDG